MKKIIENRELIIANMILVMLTVAEIIVAVTGRFKASGIIAIIAFVIALIIFRFRPYGEECIAVINTMSNAIAFGTIMFYKPERAYLVYITVLFVVMGLVFQAMLTQSRSDGRI